ncbi:hypothetical protein BDU57DRAFT_597748 [Ampelomyces quisqualis]|uniref:Uncharacterized protein n=1 Tax=Ampelomyces quisqualis TaxID=50730 RepID=A0A6A5QEZ8_AMPQU|nr:hypothetical protein BDU57DRAFT_597748 [Ampelomyces quisqualis]
MSSIYLVIVLVCLPILVGGCLAAAGYRAYRARRLSEQEDVERAQIIGVPRHGTANAIAMRPLESSSTHRSWPISRRFSDVVSKDVAPVAIPLPIPKEDFKGTGGGFVTYYESQHRNGKERMVHDHERDTANEHATSPHATKHTTPHAGQSNHEYPSKDIAAPQPIYTPALHGHFNYNESPRATMYNDNAKVADAWDKIYRRVSLVKPPPAELPADEFENVDINGSSNGWGKMRRADVEDSRFSIGEENKNEWKEDGKRMSNGSGRSITRASYKSDAGEKSAVSRSSWRMQSSHPSRNSVDNGRQILPNSVSRTSSSRETGSRWSSTMERIKALRRLESDDLRRDSVEIGEEERKQSLAATLARLTGQAESDSK